MGTSLFLCFLPSPFARSYFPLSCTRQNFRLCRAYLFLLSASSLLFAISYLPFSTFALAQHCHFPFLRPSPYRSQQQCAGSGKFNEFPSRVCSSNIISFRPFLLSKHKYFELSLSLSPCLSLSLSLQSASLITAIFLFIMFSVPRKILKQFLCAERGRDREGLGRQVGGAALCRVPSSYVL